MNPSTRSGFSLVQQMLDRLLRSGGIQPRPFWALTRALILMDLRGQHYARATATQAHHVASPLFWVVGQCLTLSAISGLLFFTRLDVFSHALAGLAISVLVLASTLVVEFHEVVLDLRDLQVVGHRPISPRTYGCARLVNLLFYVGLIWAALNIFPLILGSGLRDAGPWYACAYLLASWCATSVTVAIVVVPLSFGAASPRLENWKQLLAWVQILLLFIVFYGGQLMLRKGTHDVEMWAAFPPAWLEWLPPTWLGRFVEECAVQPDVQSLVHALWLVLVGAIATGVTLWRLSRLYRDMHPLVARHASYPMSTERVGGLAFGVTRRLTRGPEERAGFWLCLTLVRREAGLKMKCLWPLNMALATILLGIGVGQFANPLVEQDPAKATLPILSTFLIPLAVPPILFQLSLTEYLNAGWNWYLAPMRRPDGAWRGVCKALMFVLMTPVAVLWFCVAAWTWRDPLCAGLHAALAWALCWPMAIVSLWLVVPGLPFSQAPTRGATLGGVALPLAILSSLALLWGAFHYLWLTQPIYWIGSFLACALATWLTGRLARKRLTHLWRGGA